MFRNRAINNPAHLRDDYRLDNTQLDAPPWQTTPQATGPSQENSPPTRHRPRLTTLAALELIRLRFETARREAMQQRAA